MACALPPVPFAGKVVIDTLAAAALVAPVPLPQWLDPRADQRAAARADRVGRCLGHHRTGKPHGVIHTELRKATGGPPAAMATADELLVRIDTLRAWRPPGPVERPARWGLVRRHPVQGPQGPIWGSVLLGAGCRWLSLQCEAWDFRRR